MDVSRLDKTINLLSTISSGQSTTDLNGSARDTIIFSKQHNAVLCSRQSACNSPFGAFSSLADAITALEEVSMGQEYLSQTAIADKNTSGGLMTHSALANPFQRQQFRDHNTYGIQGIRNGLRNHCDCPAIKNDRNYSTPDPITAKTNNKNKSNWESKEEIGRFIISSTGFESIFSQCKPNIGLGKTHLYQHDACSSGSLRTSGVTSRA